MATWKWSLGWKSMNTNSITMILLMMMMMVMEVTEILLENHWHKHQPMSRLMPMTHIINCSMPMGSRMTVSSRPILFKGISSGSIALPLRGLPSMLHSFWYHGTHVKAQV